MKRTLILIILLILGCATPSAPITPKETVTLTITTTVTPAPKTRPRFYIDSTVSSYWPVADAMNYWKATLKYGVFVLYEGDKTQNYPVVFLMEINDCKIEHVGVATETYSGFTIELNRCGPKYPMQLVAHELGHVLGLDDSNDPRSLMYAYENSSLELTKADWRQLNKFLDNT